MTLPAPVQEAVDKLHAMILDLDLSYSRQRDQIIAEEKTAVMTLNEARRLDDLAKAHEANRQHLFDHVTQLYARHGQIALKIVSDGSDDLAFL